MFVVKCECGWWQGFLCVKTDISVKITRIASEFHPFGVQFHLLNALFFHVLNVPPNSALTGLPHPEKVRKVGKIRKKRKKSGNEKIRFAPAP